MTFELRSPAFDNDQPIPAKYSRRGGNHSPPLEWSGAPNETMSFALIVEDPDAPSGNFRHWAAYNMSPERTTLGEDEGGDLLPPYISAVNDFGLARYDGPQPPEGDQPHHYRFRLMALDTDSLNLANDARAEDVLKAAKIHTIAEADLVGTFKA